LKKVLNKKGIVVKGILTISKNTHQIDNCEYLCNDEITRVEIPSTCDVKDGAFMGCSNLEEVVFYDVGNEENEKISIYPYAFFNCEKLKKIVLPNTVNLIGECAFGSCQNIKDVIVPSYDVDNISPSNKISPFYNSDVSQGTLHVPGEVLAKFAGHIHWEGFVTYTKIK
jgi:hypothetical protein